MIHDRSGHCAHCEILIGRYPGFHQGLSDWFFAFQKLHPEFHVAEAGRGHVDQEVDFHKGGSKAHWGHSAHNFNCALDLWVMAADDSYSLPENVFLQVLAPQLPQWIEWYGWPSYKHRQDKMWELPHIQVRAFEMMKQSGAIWLVEKYPVAA